MTIVRLGYVSMSVNIKNCSPSQTMTFSQFNKIGSRDSAIKKLERIAQSNIQNCLRLLKHNLAHDIKFFRLSSRLIPLATHEEVAGLDYIQAVSSGLSELGNFAKHNQIRLGFHPDHFNVINTPREKVFIDTIKGLQYHQKLLLHMGLDTIHRLVLHVGGMYQDKSAALERFVTNWNLVPRDIQRMIILENDDKSFTLGDTLFLGEKLGIPVVFDLHHQMANHAGENWENEWERVIDTWNQSPFPIKMHISSPKSEKEFRAHADYIDPEMFFRFLDTIKGSVPQLDCMIEAKKKDQALFKLMEDIQKVPRFECIDEASFIVH